MIVLRWYIRSHLHLTNIIFMNENRHQKQNKKKLNEMNNNTSRILM